MQAQALRSEFCWDTFGKIKQIIFNKRLLKCLTSCNHNVLWKLVQFYYQIFRYFFWLPVYMMARSLKHFHIFEIPRSQKNANFRHRATNEFTNKLLVSFLKTIHDYLISSSLVGPNFPSWLWTLHTLFILSPNFNQLFRLSIFLNAKEETIPKLLFICLCTSFNWILI